jgi:hypothetical protein
MIPARTDHRSLARDSISAVNPCPVCSASSLLKTWPHPRTCRRSTTMFPEDREWRRTQRRVTLMTIVAGVAAFNAFASVVAGGPNSWTLAWFVALVVALLLLLVKVVRA